MSTAVGIQDIVTKAQNRAKAQGKTLDEVMQVHVAEVVRYGDRLTLPAGMTIEDAIVLLYRRLEYEKEVTKISSTFDCFPWDGAAALFRVLKSKFGWVSMESVFSFFGSSRPEIIEVKVGVDQVAAIPWGRLTLFREEGWIDTTFEKVGKRFVFKAVATVQRKHEGMVRDIFAEVREELKRNSIYRGKAVSIRFLSDDGDPLPIADANFVDVRGAHKEQLIFAQDVHDAIETNLFMPIERMQDIVAAGMPAKHGVLIAGAFGVGKTLAARVAAALAVEHGITFIYCKRADELAMAIQFAQQYEPACVFCEDIDRTLNGERSVQMDDILNIIDGIDTKKSKVITILTTNDATSINQANLRPGRLDAVIDVKKPDSFAVERLIRFYGGADLAPSINLQRVAATLAGHIPAVIEEVVKRAKRSALRRTAPGNIEIVIDEESLAEAAATMRMQLDLLSPAPKVAIESIEGLVGKVVKTVVGREIEEALPRAIQKGIEKYREDN